MQISMRLAVVLGLATCNAAHAQAIEMVRLTNITDCSVFWTKAEAVAFSDERVKWTGKGACVGGMAEGLWTLRRDSSYPVGDEIKPMGWSEVSTHFHAGRPFGWVRKVQVQENHDVSAVDLIGAPPDKPVEWVRQLAMIQLLADGAGVVFSDAVWGIKYSAQDLVQRQWPDFSGTFSPPNLHGQGLGALMGGSSAGGALFAKTSCALEKGMYPECSFEPGKPNFHIYYFHQSSPGTTLAPEKTYCPDPRQLNSCAAMGEAIAAQKRAGMHAAAEAFRSLIAEQFKRMDETLALASAPRPSAPSAAAPDLDGLPVGGLYAAADEALQRGDKPAAKAALRALLRRFPDHPLAVVAAQQLGQL